MMTNSLVSNQKNELNKDDNDLQNVNILNFSSADQSQLRNSMIFSGLDVIKYNLNRKKNNLKLFEIGKEYHKSNNGKYLEKEKLSVFIYGDRNNLNWNTQNKKSDFFYLKGVVNSIIKKLGFNSVKSKPLTTNNIQEGETIYYQKSEILSYGIIDDKICKKFEINENVLYAELDVNMIIDKYSDQPIHFKKISKFPEVSRDLSILIDKEVRFEDIYKTVRQINQKLIKEISLFDVFQGKNLPDDKKSYGIAFKIQDNDKTLSESEIEGLMKKIISKIEKDFKAELR